MNSLSHAGKVAFIYFNDGAQASYEYATSGGEGWSFFSKSTELSVEFIKKLSLLVSMMEESKCELKLTLVDDAIPEGIGSIIPDIITLESCLNKNKICTSVSTLQGYVKDQFSCVPRGEFINFLKNVAKESLAKRTFTIIAQGHQYIKALPPTIMVPTIAVTAGCVIYTGKQVFNNIQDPSLSKIAKAAAWGIAGYAFTAITYALIIQII